MSKQKQRPTFSAFPDDMVVEPLPRAAEIVGTTIYTLRREIAAGRGPRITQISARRQGVTRRALREWLDARTS